MIINGNKDEYNSFKKESMNDWKDTEIVNYLCIRGYFNVIVLIFIRTGNNR